MVDRRLLATRRVFRVSEIEESLERAGGPCLAAVKALYAVAPIPQASEVLGSVGPGQLPLQLIDGIVDRAPRSVTPSPGSWRSREVSALTKMGALPWAAAGDWIQAYAMSPARLLP